MLGGRRREGWGVSGNPIFKMVDWVHGITLHAGQRTGM